MSTLVSTQNKLTLVVITFILLIYLITYQIRPMNYKDHLKYGIVASVSLAYIYVYIKSDWKLPLKADPGETALVFGLCLAGSLSPDLDVQSKPSQIVAFFGSIFCAISLYFREPYPALIFSTIFLFIKSFSHRSWVHTYTLPFVLALFGIFSEIWLIMPFTIGMIVHYRFGDKMKVFKKSNWIKSIKIL